MLKINSPIKSIALSFLLCHAASVYAWQNAGDIEGLYIPASGSVESLELYPGANTGEQLGRFKIVLKRQGWNLLPDAEQNRIRKRLIVKGTLHGLVEISEFAANISHQLTNDERTGSVFTANDNLLITGVIPCSQTAVVFQAIETLKFSYGTGIYQTLQPEGSVQLAGTIDNCTAQIDFDVIRDQGGLCFGTESCN